MFTRSIKHTVQLRKSGVRWFAPTTTSNLEIPDQSLTQRLQAVKLDTTKSNKDAEYIKIIAEAFPNDLKKQLGVVNANKGAGMVLDGEAIGVRIGLVIMAQESNSRQYQDMIAELEKIIAMNPPVPEKNQAEALKTQLENAKSSYEQGVATTKVILETQTANLSREKYFADKNISWTGLLAMIKKEQGTNKTAKSALDALITKFDNKGWDASREEEKDNALLDELQRAGYLRFSGSIASLEYGHKVIAAIREIKNDWKKYESVIVGTEALDSMKFTVPKSSEFDNWKVDNQKVANFLADVSGDGILSQTNQVARMGFLGIFGREDMNKKQLSELGAAKLLQDELSKPNTDFWTKLGVPKPTKIEEMEGARRALFLRVALAEGNPDALRDPSLADKITNRQITEQTKQLEANNKARLEAVKKALGEKNKNLSPELLDQAGKSFLTAVDVGSFLVGTGVSLEELARNAKIDGDNPKAFTLLSAGKKWEKQLSQNLQGHLGAGGGVGVDTSGGFFAGVGVDGGIKLIMQDNGKLSVAKGNQTLELNVGVGTSLLGFSPVGTVELAYRWNDVISALQSSDAKTRGFLKGLFKTDDKGNITMVEPSTKNDTIKALAGDDKYGEQDIKMAIDVIKNRLASNDLNTTEKVIAVQNFIENFARYNEIRNYQSKQGFQIAGVGFGVLAGPAVLAPFVRLIGQNIQSGYRVDAEKTKKVAETKAGITLSSEALAKAPNDTVTTELLKKRGATITEDGRGIDVSKARFADVSIIGSANKIDKIYSDDQSIVIGYQPKSKDERLVSIVQTSRDMNGAETYTLLLTTVPAEKTTVKDKIDKTATTIPEKLLSDGEQKSLNHIVTNWKDLPDTLPGDTISFRKKYPQMENANNLDNSGKYSMDTQALKDVLTKMSQDSNLIKIINKDTLLYYAKSDNPVFLRALLGTFLALTSGGNVSRKLGLRIGADKNPTTANDVNKYLETPGLIEAELDAINKEYGATGMTKDNLLTLMRFWGDTKNPVKTGKILANMYAESAYAKQNQNGTAALPPEAVIAGEMQKYENEVIRKALIARFEVPKNLAAAGFTKVNYMTLLETGEVKFTQNNVEKTYKAAKSELHFARSALTTQRTCFNAVFAITVPIEITSSWKETTVKTIDPKTAGLGIATDTLLSGTTRASEMSGGIVGKNTKDGKGSRNPDGSTDNQDDDTVTPPSAGEV